MTELEEALIRLYKIKCTRCNGKGQYLVETGMEVCPVCLGGGYIQQKLSEKKEQNHD